MTKFCPKCGCPGGAPHTFTCPEVVNETDPQIIENHRICREFYEAHPDEFWKLSPYEIKRRARAKKHVDD